MAGYGSPKKARSLFDNHVAIVGDLVDDVALRHTSAGRPVANFRLAVPSGRSPGEDHERPSFVDIACWSDLAGHAAEHLSRGDRVVLLGRLERQSWVTKDGQRRTKLQVVADELGLALDALEPAEDGEEPPASAEPPEELDLPSAGVDGDEEPSGQGVEGEVEADDGG